MCLECGCGEVNNDHGDPRHITLDRFRAAAQASGNTPIQALTNLIRCLVDTFKQHQ
jgi:hypothetical protein